jgi:mRNA interferase RelE/StbE
VGGGARVAGTGDPEYDVRLLPAAAREYRRLQGPLGDRIRSAINGFALDPRGVLKLAGRDDYRVRVGEYRIVYGIDDAERLVIVARIAHRREVYRR